MSSTNFQKIGEIMFNNYSTQEDDWMVVISNQSLMEFGFEVTKLIICFEFENKFPKKLRLFPEKFVRGAINEY